MNNPLLKRFLHRVRWSALARRVVLACAMTLGASALAEMPAPTEIPLYPNAAPGSERWNWQEQRAFLQTPGGPIPVVQNVVQPSLLHFPAPKSKALGTSVIVAPGGAFMFLVIEHEGLRIAQQLNDLGVDVFILKYRLVNTTPGKPEMVTAPSSEVGMGAKGTAQEGQNIRVIAGLDAQQAVRVVRQRARELGLRPDRVGMIGYSAGGYVTVAAATGPVEARPNFAAPIYPAVGFPAVGELSLVPPAGAPPLFIAVAADDELTGWHGAVELYTQWRKANLPAELHIFQVGGHGFLKQQGGVTHYLDRFRDWMELNGWLTKAE